MKKFFKSVIFLSLSMLLITGCTKNKKPSLEDRIGSDASVLVSHEGVLESLEKLDIYQRGTHQLLINGSEYIFLQSRTIDLNKYLNEEVLVSGLIEKGVGASKSVLNVEKINYVDESNKMNLKKYEDRTRGFKLLYPSKWLLDKKNESLIFNFNEKKIAVLNIFDDKKNLDELVAQEEEEKSTEVTIGAQRSLRIASSNRLAFYVPNPPKKKIYRLEYFSSGLVETNGDEKIQKNLFYDLLESFELIYTSQSPGEKCGGLQKIECPENFICQLEDGSKYAEGVCQVVGDEASSSNCPYIAPPLNCSEYRISEYGVNECPTRYQCLVEGEFSDTASFRDLSVVITGENPANEVGEVVLEKLPPEKEVLTEEILDSKANNESLEEEIVAYDIPSVDEISYQYENARKGFGVLMPRRWYYSNFGIIKGDYTVGFAPTELEEFEDSIITLKVMEEVSGSAEKIGDDYYLFTGPSDLQDVIGEMKKSIILLEE